MTRLLSLAHLTAIDLPPPQLILAAARAGFDAVGLRLLRVTDTSPGYPLMTDRAMMLATQAALRETGLQVHDIEFVKIEPGIDIDALTPFVEAGAILGAREVIAAPYDRDLGRLAAGLRDLADLARMHGLGVSLEFFPWTVVPDPATAVAVASDAGPDVGVLVDALHLDRSGSEIAAVAAIPGSRVRLAHICDAPVHPPYSADDLLHAARAERLPPGEGQIDLVGFLAALPADLPLGIEVPMSERAAREGADAVIASAMAGTRRLLASLRDDDAAQAVGRDSALDR